MTRTARYHAAPGKADSMAKDGLATAQEVVADEPRFAARGQWSLVVVAVLLGAIAAPLLDLATDQSRPLLHGPASTGTLWSLTFTPIGALILTRRPRHPLGVIFCAIGVSQALVEAAWAYAAYAFDRGGLPGGVAMAWLTDWLWFVGYGLLATFVPLLFPTGMLPSSRWRPVAWLAGTGFAFVLAAGIAALPLQPGRATLGQPLPGEGLSAALGQTAMLLVLLAAPLCVLSLLERWRRSSALERQQLKWFLVASAVTVLLLSGPLLLSGGVLVDAAQALAGLLIPGAAGIAILRHRLLDIDVVINRTLVYGGLTAGVMGVYVAIVGIAATLWGRTGWAPSVLAVGVVALVVQPARERLQQAVDRLTYGEREPYAALSRLGEAVGGSEDPDSVLPTVVRTIARMLRLPYVAIVLEGQPAIEIGRRPPRCHVVPLENSSARLGHLVVAPRSGEAGLGPAERRLVGDLARQAAAAAHAVQLHTRLQEAQVQLVSAREEERRRIHRDLHDGLGPTLAGVALRLGAARRLLASDPAAADATLAELARLLEQTTTDVRRLVHGLRPPTLDELGLADAVRTQAERLFGDVVVTVESTDLGQLPAAVETAAFRIIEEALTNVARHAHARTCLVRLERNGGLDIDVIDDGLGIPAGAPSGLGISSMRQRAAELRGTLHITPTPGGGTALRARLPLEGL
jgi:signal transduction histidine kinase